MAIGFNSIMLGGSLRSVMTSCYMDGMRFRAVLLWLSCACGGTETPTDAGSDGAIADAPTDVATETGGEAGLDGQADAPLDHRRVFVTSKPIMVANFLSVDNADTTCDSRRRARTSVGHGLHGSR